MPTITREEYLKGVKADLHNMEKQSDDPMVVQQSQARAWLVNTAAIALIGDPAKTDKDDVLNTDHLVAVKTEIARHSTKLIESYYNFCVKGEYTEGADVTKVSTEGFLLFAIGCGVVNTGVNGEKKRKQLLDVIKKRGMTPVECIFAYTNSASADYTNKKDVFPYEYKSPKEVYKLYKAHECWKKGDGLSHEINLDDLDSYKAELEADPIDALMLRNPRVGEACLKNDRKALKKSREALIKSFKFNNLNDVRTAQKNAARTLALMNSQTGSKAAKSASWQKLKYSLESFTQPLDKKMGEKQCLEEMAKRSAQVLLDVEKFTKGRKSIQNRENQLCVDLSLDALAATVPNPHTNPCVQPLVNRFDAVRGKKSQLNILHYGPEGTLQRYNEEFVTPRTMKDKIDQFSSEYIGPPSDQRGKKWNAFSSALQDFKNMKLDDIADLSKQNDDYGIQDTAPAWTEAAKQKVNRILDTAEDYLKGKKSVRSDTEQQMRVDLTLDVLTEVAQFSDEAAMRVNMIFDRFDEVRDHKLDRTQFGLDNMGNDRRNYALKLSYERDKNMFQDDEESLQGDDLLNDDSLDLD